MQRNCFPGSLRFAGYLLFSIILIVRTPEKAKAGDSLYLVNNLRLGVDLNYGTILPHHSSIRYSLESNITGAEILVTTDSYGRNNWDAAYRFPRWGAGYKYTTLGNGEVFGKAYASFLFMDIPFSAKQKRLRISYQFGLGLSWLTKEYSVESNPLNMAVSSGLNVYASLKFNMALRLHEYDELAAGFGFNHFSNGKMATPNLGLNTFNFYAGYRYTILPPRYQRSERSVPDWKRRHLAELIVSAGTKTDDQVTGIYYLISSIVADYKYNFARKYSLVAGLDIFYDQALGPNKVADEGGSYTTEDLFQAGLHGGLSIQYSRLNLIFQAGSYIHASYYKYVRVYSRLGVRYEVIPGLLLSCSLKSHLAIADYVEWGIGYRFNIKGGRE